MSEVELTLRGDLDHLRVAWQTGEALLESVPFRENAEQTRYNVLLAVQEMLTNVLRHGADEHGELIVRLRFVADEAGFEVEIADRGAEFDPCAHQDERPTAGEMPSEPGGYGILIARCAMDTMEYERSDGWNCLRMRKAAGRPEPTAPPSGDARPQGGL